MGEDDYSWLTDALGGGSTPDPESGSFIGPNGTDVNGQTPGDYTNQINQAGEGLDEHGNGPQDPGFNWASPAGQAIMAGGGGDSSGLSGFLKSIGLGGSNMGGLLSALLTGAGGIYAHNQTQKATDAALSRISDTQNTVGNILGNNANGRFTPYLNLGQQGASGLAALPTSNIAGNFNPLGTGRGIKLGQLAGK